MPDLNVPPDALCIVPECDNEPTTTRPLSSTYITASGVLSPGYDIDEWVCSDHA